MSLYTVERVHIGTSDLLDTLARECERLSSTTVTCFWRTVRKQGIWLKPAAMMRWLNSDCLVQTVVIGDARDIRYLKAIGHPVDRLMAHAKGFRYRPHFISTLDSNGSTVEVRYA